MSHLARRLATLAAVSFAAAVLLPSAASAQYREFTGRIDRVNSKLMIVDNRMGDKVKFVVDKEKGVPEVKGKKTKWSDLKKKDWVTVSWKFTDKPRHPYIVEVLDKKDEDEE